MPTDPRALLAVGLFGGASRLGDRIESLLKSGRAVSTRISFGALSVCTVAIVAFAAIGSHAPQWIALAQDRPLPSFEVSSVKANRSGDFMQRVTSFGNGRFAAENLQLDFLIQMAYHLRSFQVVGGPGWLGTDHYDFDARAEGASREQMYLYLQKLLADRFHLQTHTETKEMAVFELHVARTGSRLQPARDACFDPLKTPSPPPPGTPSVPCGGFWATPSSIVGAGVPMAQLLKPLGDSLGREVIDKTGLTGTYDVHLEWTSDGAADADNRSLITALQEVGLRLESTKGRVETLVIDHLEKPDAN